MDLAKYLDLYLTEGREHLSLMRKGLPGEGPVPADGVNDLFRHAHSIKGMAASMGFEATARLAHELESLLGQWRGGHSASLAQVRVLEAAVDALDAFFDEVQRSSSDAASTEDSERMLSALRDCSGTPRRCRGSRSRNVPCPSFRTRYAAAGRPPVLPEGGHRPGLPSSRGTPHGGLRTTQDGSAGMPHRAQP